MFFIRFILLCGLCFLQFFLLASEPTANPTNFSVSGVKPWGFYLNFSNIGASGYLILRSQTAITDTPTDGVNYKKGDRIGTAKVAYVGASNASIWIREVIHNQTYNFAIFAFNGTGSAINYKQMQPLTGTATAAQANPGNYYQNVHPSNTFFLDDLHDLLFAHKKLSYGPGMYDLCAYFHSRDTTNGDEYVTCQYSGEVKMYTPPISFNAIGYNREHVLPKSWMPTYATKGTNITNDPEGSDYHMLALCKATVNSARFNYPFDVVNGTPTFSYLGFKQGKNTNNQLVAEPIASIKGDVARAIMYGLVCYNGLGGSWALNDLLSYGPQQVESVLKQWHAADPPSDDEKTRHEYVAFRQENRNPFIDHPDWVECIDFTNLLTKACALGIAADDPFSIGVNIFPQPAATWLQIEMPKTSTLLGLRNALGAEVDATFQPIGEGKYSVELQQLPTGYYWLVLKHEAQTIARPFLIAR